MDYLTSTIIKQDDVFITRKEFKPTDKFSLFSNLNYKQKIIMFPIYIFYWLYLFISLYFSNKQFSISVYDPKKLKTKSL